MSAERFTLREWSLTLLAVCIAVLSQTALGQNAEKLAAQLCATCHGVSGRSESPMFPRLDAQTPPYLEAQLKGFRNHARGESDARAYMWGIASQLDDGAISALAEYYGHQSAPPGAAGVPDQMAMGKDIFEHGVAEQGVPACAACHGPHAEGNGTFPRLAGQHQAYLLRQIEVFKAGTRANAPMMSAVAHTLTDVQAKAVAAYLQSQ